MVVVSAPAAPVAVKLRHLSSVPLVTTSVDRAVGVAVRHDADVLVVDLAVGAVVALDLVRRSQAFSTPVLMVFGPRRLRLALSMLRLGAVGAVAAERGRVLLTAGLRGVMGGGVVVPAELQTAWDVSRLACPVDSSGLRPVRSSLTPGEWTVLDLLCLGYATGEVAQDMGIGNETVRTHVKGLLGKTRTTSRAGAVRWADVARGAAVARQVVLQAQAA